MMLYDTIGRSYARHRRQDPRIGAHVVEALDGASSVVNVGAGAGSYEPHDLNLVAVEPSLVMIRQRDATAAPVVRASANDLPPALGTIAMGMCLLARQSILAIV